MTLSIALILLILVAVAVLFVTEWLSADVVALLVLSVLALTGLVTPAQALSGFSNPAVITIWAMFIISGAMARTGVASLLSTVLLRAAGTGERRLLSLLMTAGGGMAAFMSSSGLAALLLPVVMDISRRLKRPPSRLLMPLVYACLLGGMTTLIGSSTNLLVGNAVRDAGLIPFGLFDFAWMGLPIMAVGVTFMLLTSHKLLPAHTPQRQNAENADLLSAYDVGRTLHTLRVPPHSSLEGQTIAETALGAMLGLTLIGIERGKQRQLAPTPDTRLQAGDRLLVEGDVSQLVQLHHWHQLIVENDVDGLVPFRHLPVALAEVTVLPRANLIGKTVEGSDLRARFGVTIVALSRDGAVQHMGLNHTPLQAGDTLLIQGAHEAVEGLGRRGEFEDFRLLSEAQAVTRYHVLERLLRLRVPDHAWLRGKTLRDSRLGDALDLTVLAILRNRRVIPATPETTLRADDVLLVKGRAEVLTMVRHLISLEMEAPPLRAEQVETGEVGLAEVVLSPRTTLTGKTLRALHFRDKYGLSVLSILRDGQKHRTDLADMPLRFGDALLLYGPREKLRILASEPDFVVLSQAVQAPPRREKAWLTIGILIAILIPVLFGWLHISIASLAGAALMVACGCLTMEEAYRDIEWKAIFLIAGLLPLGIAMQQSGAAQLLASVLVAISGGLGVLATMSLLFWVIVFITQMIPSTVVVVFMAPIALSIATDLGASPYSFMMLLAISGSINFLSPVSHPANVLIMGPGGYQYRDYVKFGLPLTAVIWVVTMLLLPRVWGL